MMSTISGQPLTTGMSDGRNVEDELQSSRDGLLLFALTEFIHPIVKMYAPALDDTTRHSDIHNSLKHPSTSSAGAKLLLAFREFVKASTIQHSPGNEVWHGSVVQNGRVGSHMPVPELPTYQNTIISPIRRRDNSLPFTDEKSEKPPKLPDRPKKAEIKAHPEAHERPPPATRTLSLTIPVPDVLQHRIELSSHTLEALRKRIFNGMPIRLLAFDADGNDLQLLDRNEVQRRCAFSIFQTLQQVQLTPNNDRSGVEAEYGEGLVEGITKYAILSHTWMRGTPGDVIYKDWNYRQENVLGNNKITNFCKIAARDHNITLGWMDTVCINKDSSTELDESIRSMYKWYRGAEICIAYLAETSRLETMFRDSWFTRGWTLQELLAPLRIWFYDSTWQNLGNHDAGKSATESKDILTQVEYATTITTEELYHFREGFPDMVTISRRLELAARREVTREEDEAYSLMGILDVDIPVAYGEGRKRAFFRLMRELVASKKSFLDIFNCALAPDGHGHRDRRAVGLIPSDITQYLRRASSFDFMESDPEYDTSRLSRFQPIEPILLTHLGLRVPLLLAPALPAADIVDRDYSPLGDFSGVATLRHYSNTKDYFLLHQDIFSAQPYTRYYSPMHFLAGTPTPNVVTFGILNFETSNDIVVIPKLCLSIPLDCGTKVGNVSLSDPVQVIANHDPAVFELKSRSNWNRVPKNELATHGLQLVTLYL